MITSDPSGGCRFLLSAQVQAIDGFGAWREIIDLISRINIDLISLELMSAPFRGNDISSHTRHYLVSSLLLKRVLATRIIHVHRSVLIPPGLWLLRGRSPV